MSKETSILFVGDVVGSPGRRALRGLLPRLRERYDPQFVVVNGENAAGGVGITPKVARELFAAGVDVITLGNHTYRHREVYGYLDEEERILRPANFLRSQPGHGWCTVSHDGVRLGVGNILVGQYHRNHGLFIVDMCLAIQFLGAKFAILFRSRVVSQSYTRLMVADFGNLG